MEDSSYLRMLAAGMDKLASYGITHKRIPQWMMPAGADMPLRFDIAMLHKRDVDVR
jgi:hypothetical protein